MLYFSGDEDDSSNEIKSRISEWFLEQYPKIEACDIYRWIWEGEYGGKMGSTELTLDYLTNNIREARIHGRRPAAVWEPMGLAMLLVKINLVTYADQGCPLLRLLMLEERSREIRPNPMRFKHDWSLMKSQLAPGMAVSVEKLIAFENAIPFHTVPEVKYSETFLKEYGSGYRIVPRNLFFNYFPEYRIEEKEEIIG